MKKFTPQEIEILELKYSLLITLGIIICLFAGILNLNVMALNGGKMPSYNGFDDKTHFRFTNFSEVVQPTLADNLKISLFGYDSYNSVGDILLFLGGVYTLVCFILLFIKRRKLKKRYLKLYDGCWNKSL